MSFKIVPQDAREIEIVGGGEERMDPRVMSLITSLGQLAQQNRIRKLEESKIPETTYSVTLAIITELEYIVYPPWISFSLINDGPGTLFLHVNGNKPRSPNQAPVLVGGRLDIDFKYPVINKIYFQCVTVLPVSIRLTAMVGKASI